jgi:hypothetical protein
LYSEKEDIDLPNSFPPVYMDSSNVISWIGEPLKPREGIFYYVRQGSNSGGHSYISKTGITSFTIDAFHLNGLAPGEATLHILRETYLEGISESDGLNNGERIIQVETEKTFVING